MQNRDLSTVMKELGRTLRVLRRVYYFLKFIRNHFFFLVFLANLAASSAFFVSCFVEGFFFCSFSFTGFGFLYPFYFLCQTSHLGVFSTFWRTIISHTGIFLNDCCSFWEFIIFFAEWARYHFNCSCFRDLLSCQPFSLRFQFLLALKYPSFL